MFYSTLLRLVKDLLEFSQRTSFRTFDYLCYHALIIDLQLGLSRVLGSPNLII
jgi:DNA-directed RNA polymerase specialized sigma24 family protein